MAAIQPVCGPFPRVEGPALSRTVGWVFGAIGFVASIVSAIAYVDKAVEGVKWVAAFAGPSTGIALAAASGALVGFAIGLGIVFSKGLDRLQARPGRSRCYSGVVNTIALAYSSGEDWAFPYAAQHDRVDVVVKPTYWGLINAPPAVFAYCAADRRMSALIRSYFFSNKVKAGAEGAMAGAVIGGIGAAVAGYFAGVGVAAAIGAGACAASLWFYLVCLLVVILVAVIVALVLTLISATVGGAIGAGASSGSGAPSTTPAPGVPGGSTAPIPIAPGQYITLNATLVIYGEDNDAWVGWWVDVTTPTATPVLHGVSMAGEGPAAGTPFNFVDARDGFTDMCPVV